MLAGSTRATPGTCCPPAWSAARASPESVTTHPTDVRHAHAAVASGRCTAAAGAPRVGPAGTSPCARTAGRCTACTATATTTAASASRCAPDCYDYVGHVLWQWHAPELWRRFTHRARTPTLARRAGVTAQAVRATLARVSYTKVVEFQARGLIHVHAVVRLDGPTGPDSPPGVDLDALDLGAAIAHRRRAVRLDVHPAGHEPVALRWGAQVDTRPITLGAGRDDQAGDAHPEMVAAYLAKYLTKSTEDFGLDGHGRVHPPTDARYLGASPARRADHRDRRAARRRRRRRLRAPGRPVRHPRLPRPRPSPRPAATRPPSASSARPAATGANRPAPASTPTPTSASSPADDDPDGDEASRRSNASGASPAPATSTPTPPPWPSPRRRSPAPRRRRQPVRTRRPSRLGRLPDGWSRWVKGRRGEELPPARRVPCLDREFFAVPLTHRWNPSPSRSRREGSHPPQARHEALTRRSRSRE